MGDTLRAVSLVFVLALALPCGAEEPAAETPKKYADPARLEKEIERFETADKETPPPKGAIVCVGSSSMKGWHGALRADLEPLTVIPRGFGGSTTNDLRHYAARIVIAYAPRAVVVYEGDNDIAQGIDPRTVAETFAAFAAEVRRKLPACRIYVLSIKPSISRWKLWPKAREANRLISEQCAGDPLLTFVDISAAMLDAQGQPRKELFRSDHLHMTREGYEVWRDVLRPVLMKAEAGFEPAARTEDRKGAPP